MRLHDSTVAPVGGFRLPLKANRERQKQRQYRIDDLAEGALLNTALPHYNKVRWYPTPSRMRSALKGDHWWLYRSLVIATSALAVVGAAFSYHGAQILEQEAASIRRYGIQQLSEARRDRLGQRGWAWFAGGYAITMLQHISAVVYSGLSTRMPVFVAVYPEHQIVPHLVRAAGFAIGDAMVAFTALYICLQYNYGTNIVNDKREWDEFEDTYAHHFAGASPYVLFGIGCWYILVVLIIALLWEGGNVCYCICFARCGYEWDALASHPRLEREAQERAQEAKYREVIAAEVAARQALQLEKGVTKTREKDDLAKRAAKRAQADKVAKEIVIDDATTDAVFDYLESFEETTPPQIGIDGADELATDAVLTDLRVYAQESKAETRFSALAPWRRILQFYNDSCGCLVHGKGSKRGMRVRTPLCFATLAHNWWGALRMHVYVSAVFFAFMSYELVQVGHYTPFESGPKVTWPVYVPDFGIPPLSWEDYIRTGHRDGIVPPPMPPPPDPPHPHPPPSPPSPPPAPFSPSPPPSTRPAAPPSTPPPSAAPGFPPWPPMLPREVDERAFPKIPATNQKTREYPPYPYQLSRANDASFYMESAAWWLWATELLRLIGSTAYWIGVLRNEASVPASHLDKPGCWQSFCP